MRCAKCGRETQGDSFFCVDCQMDMQAHPVKPGIVVLLPKREEPVPGRRNHPRPAPTTQERLRLMSRKVRLLSIALAVCLLLLGGLLFFLAEHYKSHADPLPGQNYSTVTAPPTED